MMKFSEQIELFLDELEAHTVEPVEGVAIEVVRERWIPLLRQLEAEIETLQRIGEDKVILNERVHALEAENEELETNLSLAISMYEGEDSPMAKLEQEKAQLEAENEALRDVVRDCVNFLADLETKSDRAKALHKRAYTAHSKAKEK